VSALSARWPGLQAIETEGALRISIPPVFRVGHEAHFAQVANRFFDFVRAPGSMPSEELPNMLAKYYVCTRGVELARSA
jgi:hypothetical protein